MKCTCYKGYIVLLCCLSFMFIAACKKKSDKPTSCTSTLYGYHGPEPIFFDSVKSRSVGVIDPATFASTVIGEVTACAYSNQGAFNNVDDCYYTFKKQKSPFLSNILYKVSLSGVVTELTGYSGCHSLTYNKVTKKLYCIAPYVSLAEVVISGTSFTVKALPSLHSTYGQNSGSSTTVDDNTGAIYYTTYNSLDVYIEKYVPGNTPVTVATIPEALLMGLRFNKNDKMLYAIREPATPTTFTHEFIKIDPVSGTVTTLSQFSYTINRELYAACIDPCNDRYILSAITRNSTGVWDSCIVSQLSTAGSVVQYDITDGFFQGLYINYR